MDDLIETIQRLKASLNQASTGGAQDISDTEYREIRKTLLNHPDLGPKCPIWLRRGATHAEAVSLVRDEAGEEGGKWKRRGKIIIDGLNPLIDVLEGSDVFASDSLNRLDRLGSGGFGEVYRYHHKFLNMDFALKILNPVFATDSDHAMERFFREARILFQLQHQNIVRIYDVGLISRRPFIRMELLEGQSLARIIRDAGRMSIEEAHCTIAILVSALRHAHEDVRVVHRDLKPSNVMKTTLGRTVIVDFGLGAFVEGEIVSRITRTGESVAGGLYTSPELIADPRLLDPKTDIYSLGAIWYELLTGRPPGGTRIESALDDIPDLQDAEKQLIIQCLGPLATRPSAAMLNSALK
jgi:eukaryotic-like serine/threonine-protein kinase